MVVTPLAEIHSWYSLRKNIKSNNLSSRLWKWENLNMNSLKANRAIIFFSLGRKYKENYISHEERLLWDHLNKSFVRHLTDHLLLKLFYRKKESSQERTLFFLRSFTSKSGQCSVTSLARQPGTLRSLLLSGQL